MYFWFYYKALFDMKWLKKIGIHPNNIKIEITERNNIHYYKISDFSFDAKKRGFQISLDDFG